MGTPNFILRTISTFFYIGYLPFAPGTFASIAALSFFFAVKGNDAVYLSLAAGLTLLGFLVSGRAEKGFGRKDPPCIVIDEVSGMLLSLLFIPYDVRLVIAAFILFRVLDIFKPYPARRVQDLPGSIGIMGDDIIAALYTNIIVQVFLRVASFKAS